MDSDEDWVVLRPDNPASSDSDDDGIVLVLSSSPCSTPRASDGEDKMEDQVDDDGEAVYEPEYAEDDDPPRSPPPGPLAGFFQNASSTRHGTSSYAAFDTLRGAKLLVPDPGFSAFPEPVTVMASNRGLLCLSGHNTGLYYIANPATFKRKRLPLHQRDHCAFGTPSVVITFDDKENDDIDHYHVVVAFNIGDGIFGFETFSSRTWNWRVGGGVYAVEQVISNSGVGALGRAFWRTAIGYILGYNPEADCADTIYVPPEVERLPLWELGEMEGNLCLTCMDEPVNEVAVLYLDMSHAAGEIPWAWAGQVDPGNFRSREGIFLLRSQGAAEVVMCDPEAKMVVAMDLEGRTTRTIGPLGGCKHSESFIPYVTSVAAISSEQIGVEFGCCAAPSKALNSTIPSGQVC